MYYFEYQCVYCGFKSRISRPSENEPPTPCPSGCKYNPDGSKHEMQLVNIKKS